VRREAVCRLPTDGERNDGTEVAAAEEEEGLPGGGRDAWTVELPLPLGAPAAAKDGGSARAGGSRADV
jgi:hypothetical protein